MKTRITCWAQAAGHETQRSTKPSKYIDSMQDGHQKQSGKTSLLSKQANGNIRTESLNHGDKRPNPVQPSSTLLNNGGVIPNAQLSKHIAFNHDGGRSYVELSTKANPTSGGTLIKGCKPSLHSHAENQKKFCGNGQASQKHSCYIFTYASKGSC
ncbi:hypothetical protein Cgig2_032824 [Carnegiea gigantea]|uniref:Uncharacterized protein n=1 Tax=Carnegiea gigantea TaxID=171969 RepID=A0A9Q1JRX1_9CARY|nr:hypothetical protein Cgig2_032824 [Carnegiea gigantea]